MHRITYTSREVVTFDAVSLAELLTVARERNEAAGITGCLLYSDGAFLQAFEGESAAVGTLWAALQHDRRHRDLVLLERQAVTERVFGTWSMGFAHVGGAQLAQLIPGYVPVQGPLPPVADAAAALELLVALDQRSQVG